MIARRDDWTLLTANDGYQGVKMAKAHQPVVILMDMRLPGMDGHSAMKVLRQNPATASIPVVALSSNAFKIEIDHSLEDGLSRYVTKPYKIDKLMEIIDAALQHAAKNRSPKN